MYEIDYIQVQLAEKFGTAGLLLYCHPEDCVDPDPQFTSVADFSGEFLMCACTFNPPSEVLNFLTPKILL